MFNSVRFFLIDLNFVVVDIVIYCVLNLVIMNFVYFFLLTNYLFLFLKQNLKTILTSVNLIHITFYQVLLRQLTFEITKEFIPIHVRIHASIVARRSPKSQI